MLEGQTLLLAGGLMLLVFFGLGAISHRARLPLVLLFMAAGLAVGGATGGAKPSTRWRKWALC